MKILIANKFFFRNGGSETVMFQERDFLIGAGIEVVDFAMSDERNFESPNSDNFVSSREYKAGSAISKWSSYFSLIHSCEAVRKISKLIDETKPDIVHLHNIYHQLTPSIIGPAKDRGIPVVMTLHDYKVICPTYMRVRNRKPCSLCIAGDFSQVLRTRCAGNSIAKSALLYAEAQVQKFFRSYDNVDRFLAPSRFMYRSVLDRLPADKVIILPNGIDISKYTVADCDSGYVLYVGRLSEEKGVETLLKAHKAAGAPWPLIIAGAGPMQDSLRAEYVHARFVGHLAGEPLFDLCRRAAVIVVPSEWYENAPMSILEAMAFGKPVVASRIGGIPELVKHDETGLLFEPGNCVEMRACIDRLLSDADLRKRMGAAGRDRVASKHALKQHNELLLDIYASLQPKPPYQGQSRQWT